VSVKLINIILVVGPILSRCYAFAFVAFELNGAKYRIHCLCLRDKFAKPSAQVKGSVLALIDHNAHFHRAVVNLCLESTIVLITTFLALDLLSLLLRFMSWCVRFPSPYDLPGHVIVDFIVIIGC
jgi:hypothetical protein